MSPWEKKFESLTENVVAIQEEQDDFVLLREDNRKAAERHIVRKLDTRLIPTVVMIYMMNYIDRVAATAAKLQDLEGDLGLTDVQYETVLAVLYASYASAQIPSNMILGYISKPSIYIAACAMAWGLMSALTGVTKNFAGILSCRILIGLPEAAFYPGSMYLLSSWYTKKELSLRSAFLTFGLLVSNAFGCFTAAGILGNMDGKLGIAAWRWLFFIEGSITILIGMLSMWLLPDLPHNTRWMSPAERRLVRARLAEDTGEADENSSDATILDGLKLAVRDFKVWVFMSMNFCLALGGSFSDFFPTFTATLGYNTTDTLLIAAPPWIFAAVCCMINAWHCDRTGERYFHISAWWWLTIMGYIISTTTVSIGARYFSLFLMTTGACGSGLILSWLSHAVPRPPAKRSVAMGLTNGVGILGGLLGSYIWKASWGPEYHQPMIIVICSLALASCLGLVMRQMLIRENERMGLEEQVLTSQQRERIEEAGKLGGISFEEAVHRRRGIRYLY